MVDHLILERKDRDKLGIVHEKFLKGEVVSFVLVAVAASGEVEVNFDLIDAQDIPSLNKMGGGLMSALSHLREMAVEKRIQSDILRGVDLKRRH